MVLVSRVEYELSNEILRELSSEMVLEMLQDIQGDIKELDSSYRDKDLINILKIVESGEYVIEGERIKIWIDLSSAKSIVEGYRRGSERGCFSCKELGKQTIDAQDGSVGYYCKQSDPDYDSKTGVKYSGPSPKISNHIDDACIYWQAKLSPPLEVLIENAGITKEKH